MSEKNHLHNVGITAIVNQSYIHDKSPMLQFILEGFVKQFSNALKDFTTEAINLVIAECTSSKFGDCLKNIENYIATATFKVMESNNYGLVTIDSKFVSAIINIIFGGIKNTYHKDIYDNKQLTLIERSIVMQIIQIMFQELNKAFSSIMTVHFVFDKLENNGNIAMITKNNDLAMILTIHPTIENNMDHGKMRLIMPYKMLMPIQEQIQQIFVDDKSRYDVEWAHTMHRAINDINVKLSVTMPSYTTCFEKIKALKIGDTLLLHQDCNSNVVICIGNKEFFYARLGKIGHKIAVCIEQILNEKT